MDKVFAAMNYLPVRTEVIEVLREGLPGKNLYDLADEYGITVLKDGRLNKGWVGQTIERVANLEPSNAKRPDGFDFELKSTSLTKKSNHWFPKETIKITQLNPKLILEEEFEKSTLWTKLQRLILVGVHHETEDKCVVIRISAIDIKDRTLIDEIRSFWDDVRDTICAGEMRSLHNLGSSQTLVQLRPLGTGKNLSLCPVTGEKFPARGFYATKRLITKIFEAAGEPSKQTPKITPRSN